MFMDVKEGCIVIESEQDGRVIGLAVEVGRFLEQPEAFKHLFYGILFADTSERILSPEDSALAVKGLVGIVGNDWGVSGEKNKRLPRIVRKPARDYLLELGLRGLNGSETTDGPRD
jgi:hypothetical protein